MDNNELFIQDQDKANDMVAESQEMSDNLMPEAEENFANGLTVDKLPPDVKDQLPEEGQHLFVAAFNSVLKNSNDVEMASRVAWQTIENNEHYERGADGKWQRKMQDDAGEHHPVSMSAS